MIRLLDDCDLHLKTLCARQVLAASTDPILTCSEFVDRYSTLYSETLGVEELSTVLQGVAKVCELQTVLHFFFIGQNNLEDHNIGTKM